MALLIYLGVGTLFGFIITKGEVVSWFRIQEMFRFQGLHMYGVFATALSVGILTVQAVKRWQIKSIDGAPIVVPPKVMGSGARYAVGGVIFGLGWALSGACPGPMFALAGGGVSVMAVAIAAAALGTYLYAHVRHRLPH